MNPYALARRAASVSAGWVCTLAVVFAGAAAGAGCGQKGPLVLPASPAAPASAAAAASAPGAPR